MSRIQLIWKRKLLFTSVIFSQILRSFDSYFNVLTQYAHIERIGIGHCHIINKHCQLGEAIHACSLSVECIFTTVLCLPILIWQQYLNPAKFHTYMSCSHLYQYSPSPRNTSVHLHSRKIAYLMYCLYYKSINKGVDEYTFLVSPCVLWLC